MSDIVTRLRQTRANMLGTDDEQHFWDCHDAAAEIELLRGYRDEAEAEASIASLAVQRLRLTDAEREAVELAIDSMNGVEDISASWSQRETEAIATLRGLLERCSQFAKRESDRPQPIAKRECDRSQPIECTPEPHATPGEGSVQGE